MKKFLQEFRDFAMRGNVMDLAVGVIIGGAFSAITTSLIDDIINPILGIFAGDNTALEESLSFGLPGGGEVMLGSFLNAVLHFIIMAFVVFCMVKAINKLSRKKKEEVPPPPPPEPSAEEKLLPEIRAKLKDRTQCERPWTRGWTPWGWTSPAFPFWSSLPL
ncbi:MAG: large conductance mechanosensitive channel protein MscL [Oscillospiraceae bacterium]|nr:large conductance mechanosensitive channel protein MscL [Oscillospiraceae bacterium]